MICIPELTLSIYVDGELSNEEAARVSEHLEACAGCRALVDELEQECGVLRESFEEEAAALAPAHAPAALVTAGRAQAWPWVVLGAAAAPLFASGAIALLPSLPPSLAWIKDLSLTGGLAVLLRGLSLTLLRGDQMLTPIISFTATIAFAFLLLSSASARRRLRAHAASAATLLALLTLSSSALALEHRESEERVVVAADEQVTESMLLTGMYVVVEGQIDGDVFAFARSVTIKGEIKGNLYTGAETLEVDGHVGGSLHGAAQVLSLDGQVDGGAYLIGQTVNLGPEARVGRDLLLVGEHAELRGQVGGSLHFAAGRVYLKGAVARDVNGHGERFTLSSGGSVGGDLTLHSDREEALEVEAGAAIAGAKHVDVKPWDEQERHALLTPGYYFGLLLKIVGLLLIGLLAVALVPAVVPRPPTGSGPLLRSMGVGFLVLVATPVAMVIAAITLIGLPIAVLSAVAYGFTIFLSSLVVAYFAVRVFMAPEPGQTGRLLGGTALALVVIEVVTEIPYVGAGLGFLVVILGVGALVLHVISLYKAQRSAA